jgi:Zn-dependent alcohol dehydrogenase
VRGCSRNRLTHPRSPQIFTQGAPGAARGSGRSGAGIRKATDLYRAKELTLDELLTRAYPLERINEAHGALERGEVARSVFTS